MLIYEGKEKYIFISYAHKDSQEVMPIVNELTKNGYRVWYDSGIEAGTEWPEYIEDHIINSEVVVAFMSPAAIDSRNCRNEINFALELKKEVLVVYLEDTTLLKGMRLQLNSTQSLFRKHHSSDESFIEQLLNAKIISECRGTSKMKNDDNYKFSNKDFDKNLTLIKNVCSIGTNDEEDMWPDGMYSQTINRDEFSYVFFHIFLSDIIGFNGNALIKSKIYNSDGNLIFDNDFNIEVVPENDRFTFGWILKGYDGSFVPSGNYRLVCSVNNSPDFTYHFTVSSNGADTGPSVKGKSTSGIIFAMLVDSIIFSNSSLGTCVKGYIKKGSLNTGDTVSVNNKNYIVVVEKLFSLTGFFSDEVPVKVLLKGAKASDVREGDTIFKKIQ